MRACRELGIRSVAVYSDADASAAHVRHADDAVHIGKSSASKSYLNADAVLEAARSAGVDAVHPGYGFLSERPSFAAAVEEAGLTFVGPPSSVIATMGDKAAARAVARSADVPVVPGSDEVAIGRRRRRRGRGGRLPGARQGLGRRRGAGHPAGRVGGRAADRRGRGPARGVLGVRLRRGVPRACAAGPAPRRGAGARRHARRRRALLRAGVLAAAPPAEDPGGGAGAGAVLRAAVGDVRRGRAAVVARSATSARARWSSSSRGTSSSSSR